MFFAAVVVGLNHAVGDVARAMSLVTGGGAAWATFAICLGVWSRPRLATALMAPVVGLCAAVVAYYTIDNGGQIGDTGELVRWALVAIVVGPALGLVGWRTRLDGTWTGLVAFAVVPLGFMAESVHLLQMPFRTALESGTRGAVIFGAAVALTSASVRTISLRTSKPRRGHSRATRQGPL